MEVVQEETKHHQQELPEKEGEATVTEQPTHLMMLQTTAVTTQTTVQIPEEEDA